MNSSREGESLSYDRFHGSKSIKRKDRSVITGLALKTWYYLWINSLEKGFKGTIAGYILKVGMSIISMFSRIKLKA